MEVAVADMTDQGTDERRIGELPLGLADERRQPGSRRGAARWLADRALDKIRD